MKEKSGTFTALAVIICSIFLFFVLLWAVGGLRIQEDITVSVRFSDASGLRRNAEVRYAGTRVGVVRSIELDPVPSEVAEAAPAPIVKVVFSVASDAPIPAGVGAKIESSSLIGDKFLDLTQMPGDAVFRPEDRLRDGVEIPSVPAEPGMEAALVRALLDGLGVGEEEKAAIANAITSLSEQLTMPEERREQDDDPLIVRVYSIADNIDSISDNVRSQVALPEDSKFLDPEANLAVRANEMVEVARYHFGPLPDEEDSSPPPLLSTTADAVGSLQSWIEKTPYDEISANMKNASENISTITSDFRRFVLSKKDGGIHALPLSMRLDAFLDGAKEIPTETRVLLRTYTYMGDRLLKTPHHLIFHRRQPTPSLEEIREEVEAEILEENPAQ